MFKTILGFTLAMLFYVNSYSNIYTIKLSGKVFDFEKKQVQFVNVNLAELTIFTTTNEKGEFTFSNVPRGHYHLTFSRTGYVSNTIEIETDSTDKYLEITLEKSLIETATIDVTSSFEAQDISKSSFSLSTMDSRNLSKSREMVLGSTLANLPGVNSISTGIGIGKPVIRGLSSLSVLIIHDGVKHESQQWGDEHSPEISLYDIDRIEVLRGPASLIYGSEGIGGVINIISKPLLFSDTKKPVKYGVVDLGAFTVNNQGTGNLMLGLGLKNIGFKGHFGFRKSSDVKTPEGIFLTNTLTPGVMDTINGGILSNSGSSEYEGGLSFGYTGNFGNIEGGFETFTRELQMHDSDPLATGNQELKTKQFELSGNFRLSRKFHLEPIFSYQEHSRKEFESTADKDNNLAFLNWMLKIFQGDIRLHNDLSKQFSGTLGVSFAKGKNESLGINKLIPNYNSTSYGIYGSGKYDVSKWTLTAGLRYDYKHIDINKTVFDINKTIESQNLNFGAITGSFGVVYRPLDNIDLFTNIGRGWRAPSEFELFVDGEHEGTSRVEKGILTLNPRADIQPESSLNIDLGTRIRYNIFNAEITFFRNTLQNFIYPSPTGTIDTATNLPIFNIVQDRSTIWGFEYSFQFHPLSFLLISLNGDYIVTRNNATGNSLPFSPPMKNIIEVKFQKDNLWKFYNPYFSINAKIVSSQEKVDPLEIKTDSYAIFKAGIGFDYILSNVVANFDFSVDNIFNTKYVDHLSRYKSFALNPGRSFNLKLTIPFQF
jgi:iron complex outermembrane recepter protein